jgi:hypothetical protein
VACNYDLTRPVLTRAFVCLCVALELNAGSVEDSSCSAKVSFRNRRFLAQIALSGFELDKQFHPIVFFQSTRPTHPLSFVGGGFGDVAFFFSCLISL